ncbi:hypothetical protein Tco_0768723, partial [Tanacetum coccineum]
MSKVMSFDQKSENESWGKSEEDDDDHKSDDERTKSDYDKSIDLNKTNHKESDDEFIHTPDDYDVEPANEGKGDEEMTDVEKVDAEHEEINQEVESDKVQDEVQETNTAPPATQKEKTDAPRSSSSHSVSSNYGSIFLNLDSLSSAEKEFISMLDVQVQQEIPKIQSSSLLTIPVSVILETTVLSSIPEIVTAAPVDHSTALLATIKSKVLTAVKEFLGTSLGDALHKAALNEFDQKQALFETMTASKSFNNYPKHVALYHALIESILADEDAMDQGVADKQKKRKHDDEDRDEDPPVGSDQGLKKQKTTRQAKMLNRLKSQNQLAEKAVIEAEDTDVPLNLGNDLGNTDEQPNVEVALKHDWFKNPARPPIPDPEWNTRKTVDDKPIQNWLNDLAKAKKPPLTFDALMSTPIDFYVFVMNLLQISELTKADLVGLVYNLLKGTCKSCVELEYEMEECYRALSDQLDWNNPKGNQCPYDLSKPLLCTNLEVAYDKYSALGISHWGPKHQRFYGHLINRKSKNNVYSTMRILNVTSVTVEE